MKKYVILKLFGLALLAMITLVLISILEVAVYAYLINPGHEASVYETHAEFSAPFVSGIFGFVVFFFVARYWKKKAYPNAFKLSLLFPLVYVLLDLTVLFLAGATPGLDFILIFLLANGAKFLGCYLGYRLTK
ncbi:MAG: hypothetical protein K0R65_770 [Crocinitomicaceae bacterium]|jgi:hypothetical protein|nr:hypothetical protein [Crocinitomicaceae bacterium]